jgi:hypothetical protein
VEPETINVVVSFTPCFIGFGIFCSIMTQTMGSAQPEIDMKLRLYNVVQRTSPIIQACEEGDIDKMQTLFAKGQASPFDRLDGEMSLLDLILLKITVLPMRQEPSKALQIMKNLCRMFKFLIEQNLDPGQLWAYSTSGISPLPFLTVFGYLIPPEFTLLLLDLVRAIIQHSIQDPYYQADFTGILSFRKSVLPGEPPAPVTVAALNPEHWDVDLGSRTECCRTTKEHDYAPGITHDVIGLSIKTWFGSSLDPKEAIATLTSNYFKIQGIIHTKDAAEAYDQFLYKHFIICIEAGIDPLLESGGHSLVSCIRQCDQLYVLRSALEHLKWSGDQICDLFEADLYASLAYQLAHLHIKDPKSREDHCTLQYRYIRSENRNAYIRNPHEDTRLNPGSHEPLSSTRSFDNSTEYPRTKCHKNDIEAADYTPLSIRSVVQTSINLGKEALGFLV